MKRYRPPSVRSCFKDPLFVVSLLLAITGAIQSSQGLLTELIQRYPVAFGLSMMGVSILTAVLTVIKSTITTVTIDKIPE